MDVLDGQGKVPAPVKPQRSVGHMGIELKLRAPQDDTPSAADVALLVKNDSRPVRLDGIVVKEPRPGWVTLDVPTSDGKTESWGFEGSGAASMVASGISPQILKVGNRVKIIAHPPRDDSQRTAEFMGMEVNGTYYSRGTGSNIRGK